MGVVLDVERKASVSTSVPLVFADGASDGSTVFGAGLSAVDTLPGILEITIRADGGNVRLGMAGKTASATVGWLIKDGEVWEYTDDIRKLNIIALAANTNVELMYEKG